MGNVRFVLLNIRGFYLLRHPGTVCLCGRVVDNHLPSLRDDGTVSFSSWQRLFNVIFAYNTFLSLVASLRAERAREAEQLYRTRFGGFLEGVDISGFDEALTDLLTAEGVWSRPVAEEPKSPLLLTHH